MTAPWRRAAPILFPPSSESIGILNEGTGQASENFDAAAVFAISVPLQRLG